jgi:hypothetical protein
MSKWINNAGTVMKSKDGNGFYIKVKKDFTVKEGQIIQMKTPEESLKGLLEKGFIDEAELEKRLESTPDFVKYNLTVAPAE